MSHVHDDLDAGQDDGTVPAVSVECADFLEQIVYFIDNELSADDRASVIGHIETCSPCLDRYDLQRTVKAVVARSCSEVAPSNLRSRIMVALTEVRVEIGSQDRA